MHESPILLRVGKKRKRGGIQILRRKLLTTDVNSINSSLVFDKDKIRVKKG